MYKCLYDGYFPSLYICTHNALPKHSSSGKKDAYVRVVGNVGRDGGETMDTTVSACPVGVSPGRPATVRGGAWRASRGFPPPRPSGARHASPPLVFPLRVNIPCFLSPIRLSRPSP